MDIIGVRRESVVLDLDDRVAPGLLRVAAAAEVADKAVEGLGKQQSSTSAKTRELEGDTDRLSQRLEKSASSIDQYSGRLGILIDVLASVGPAVVPIAAVAIPAVTTLGGNLISLGLGAGVADLAFHGLGSTLEKFNKAQAEPTATNIAAAQQAMDALPASSQRLVLELHRLTPLFDKLRQDAAGGGLTAGVTDGIHSLLEDTPLVRTAIRGISAELGSIARDSGAALSSNQWKPFLRFAGQEAPRDLHVMAAATGDVAHGIAEILMAFGPLDRQVGDGILRLAQDFDRWATSLGKTKDFQSFVAYIETNGPRVIDLLGDMGQLFIDLVQAAAPLGGPTVQALDDIVKLLDLIASSPVATPLIALVQALSLARLGVRGFQSVSNATFGSGGQQSLSAYGSGIKKNIALWRELNAVERSSYLTGEEAARRDAARSSVLGTLGKGALAGGAIALASTGVAQKIGVTNTAADALAGAFVGGVPGAVVGGLVGAVQDYSSAASQAGNVTSQLGAAMRSNQGDFTAQAKAIADAQDEFSKSFYNQPHSFLGVVGHGITHPIENAAFVAQNIAGNNPTDASRASVQAALQQATLSKISASQIGQGLGLKENVTDLQQLDQIASRVQPAMEQLGITWDDLNKAATGNQADWSRMVDRIVSTAKALDSTKGQTEAVASAFAGMSNQVLTADQRLQALSTSLDAALDPKINLSASRDALQQGLNDLDKNLSKTTKSLRGQSDAVIQNRAAIRTQVSGIKDLIEKQAAADPNTKRLTATLKDQRQKLLDAGTAAGISKKDMQGYINELGLTPKFVKTTIQLAGTQAANGALSYLRNQLVGLDGRVFSTTIKVTREGSTTVSTGGRTVNNADGGEIMGQRHPYGDKVLSWLAPGEQVISNRHGQADRFRADMMAGRIPGYADGGSIATHATSSPAGQYASDGVGAAASSAARGLHDLQAASGSLTKQIDAERAERQKLAQLRAQQVSTVRDGFRSQIFGVDPGSVWESGATTDPRAILRGQIRDANDYRRDIGRLQRRGLRGGALGQVQTLAEAQQALGLGRGELRDITHLFERRQHASARAGATSGNFLEGKQLDRANARLETLHHDNQRLERELARHRAEARRNSRDNAASVTKGVNGAVTSGTQRRHP